MDIEKRSKDFKALTKVVTRVDLKSIFLIACNVWRSMDALKYKSVGAEVTFNGTLFEEHENSFIAKAILAAKGIPREKHQEKEVVSIECEYVLTYSLRDRKDLTAEDIKKFCSMNVVYNAWPYWREFIQSMSNRMELPTLLLPLLKFRSPRKKAGDKNKSTK